MAHTILIPTDFSVESTQVLKEYLKNIDETERINIVFGSGFYRTENFLDLLHLSKYQLENEFKSKEFEEALHILENKYSMQVNAIDVKFFSGWNKSSFQNFLEGHQINQIIYSNELQLKNKHKKWFNLLPFIKKVAIKQSNVSISMEETEFHQVALSPLFN